MSCLELRFVNFFIKRILYCIVLYSKIYVLTFAFITFLSLLIAFVIY